MNFSSVLEPFWLDRPNFVHSNVCLCRPRRAQTVVSARWYKQWCLSVENQNIPSFLIVDYTGKWINSNSRTFRGALYFAPTPWQPLGVFTFGLVFGDASANALFLHLLHGVFSHRRSCTGHEIEFVSLVWSLESLFINTNVNVNTTWQREINAVYLRKTSSL